jgi:mono/diheme cytochrome c family protein
MHVIRAIVVWTFGILACGLLGTALDAQATGSVWDGVYTDEQAARGQAIYTDVCLACHGPNLGGGEMAPGLADGTFKSNWNGLTMGDLFDRIRESMPPDDPGRLTRQEVADALAFVLKSNRFPAGSKELANRSEMLRMIQFDAMKRN